MPENFILLEGLYRLRATEILSQVGKPIWAVYWENAGRGVVAARDDYYENKQDEQEIGVKQ